MHHPFRASLLATALLALPALAPAAEAPFASTYAPVGAGPVLITDATVLTGDGKRLENTDVLMRDGKIAAVGTDLDPAGATVVDGRGKWVTPGIIDVHSHLGVYPSPGANAHSDGNEMTSPVTSQVWAEHGVWPQDPGFAAALAGGVTSLMILPGSANLIGGRGVVLKNVPAETMQAMKFPGAPHGVKMACGENPKRVYGGRGQAPMTRMGNIAGYRAAFIEAQRYREAWDKHEAASRNEGKRRKGDAGPGQPPARDLRMETLAEVLRGEITVQIHCYRADEMALMMDLAKEFDFKIHAFHHGVEAYKLADELAAEGICGALWADWWGFKMEAYDGIQENIALVDRPANGCAVVHSDSSEGIQRLNQEAAKVMVRGERAGLTLPPEHAIRWLTANAAKAIGIADQVGTLDEGKMADVVLWNGNPFSVYAKAEKVYVDGALLHDLNDPARRPVSDFMLGQEVSP
ncbi:MULTISPECIES: amidohydrolase [unclassified Arenimonas]|uniref:amidohydrolase n=1 Tax=unclassified Arenimonas TaxID=2641713 RepID=UPI00086E4E54|nr:MULTISPECIES: amidohydrolase [unclassified Arenimonas]ODS63259.1 MAG: amidohydrolase [Arenimonas sp. SCN 70-307]